MSAIISACGMFRYRLERAVILRKLAIEPAHPMALRRVAFYGVNGSTAGPTINDRTVGKWIGFCQQWDVSDFIVGNVFGYRSKNVHDLGQVSDPIGPENDAHLAKIIEDADVHIPCWGSREKVPRQLRYRFDLVLDMLHSSGKPVKCFGLTNAGDPLHPLYLPYSTELRDFPRSAP